MARLDGCCGRLDERGGGCKALEIEGVGLTGRAGHVTGGPRPWRGRGLG